ncbi:CHAP domain-containing protein [Arboricoccus pini]|uniref:CHAP domain-containing protein n=1 Tax=Arboricoccus pini TaxID=1963835 RepID=A0A212RNR0_9PROT|nr:CHAP domain-containing protein [Arboricoccus pini]SNB74167.1 CHAP domain-containing protein [Arboricoccus pini]
MRGTGWLGTAAALTALAACATRGPGSAASTLECAPYARRVTGVALYGDGADWWTQAAGHYRRTKEPAKGAIIVFARTSRLVHGHVSVVESLISERRITVRHANWVPGRITTAQPVVDVSPGNDWSRVRVWWQPTDSLGITVYPVLGFILPA